MPSYISPLPGDDFSVEFPRRLVLLGSTGSIGRSAIKVIEKSPESLHVFGLAGARNVKLLAEQAERLRPELLAVLNDESVAELKALLPAGYKPEILVGPEGYAAMASHPQAQVALSAQVGAAGLWATLAAVQAGKVVALANKESLVLAGELIRATCWESGAVVLPVDSEHNAVFQALVGHGLSEVTRVILTASGGPFRGRTRAELEDVTAAQALKHPTWNMGAKISIDSATLMNKGLEVIEAYHLFGMDLERIDVVVHPQSAIHSLAEYRDGSVLAHLGPTDMQIAIAYCLAYPRRVPLGLPPLNLAQTGSFTFEEPDLETFPCLALAKQALAHGPAATITLNAANEIGVEQFLAGAIGFLDIPRCIAHALDRLDAERPRDLEAIWEIDGQARRNAAAWVDKKRS